MRPVVLLGLTALLLTLLALPGAVSAADVSVSGSVVDEDLSVTALAINPGSGTGHTVICANEPNTLRVYVKNTGGLAAGAFDVTMVIGSFTQTLNVASLGAGASHLIASPSAIGGSPSSPRRTRATRSRVDETNNPSTDSTRLQRWAAATAGNDFTK